MNTNLHVCCEKVTKHCLCHPLEQRHFPFRLRRNPLKLKLINFLELLQQIGFQFSIYSMKKSICFITRIKQILKLNKRCPPDNFCDGAPGFIFSVALSIWSLQISRHLYSECRHSSTFSFCPQPYRVTKTLYHSGLTTAR